MRNTLKIFMALNASLAYLSMLTGFGMLLFTAIFFYLLVNDLGLPMLLHGLLAYLMFVLGPGAITLAVTFYRKMYRHV